MVTSTDSRESSLENVGGGELDLEVNAERCGSKKGGNGDESKALMCGGEEGGIASKSMVDAAMMGV